MQTQTAFARQGSVLAPERALPAPAPHPRSSAASGGTVRAHEAVGGIRLLIRALVGGGGHLLQE
jgi:hypothetical protein